MAETQIAFHNKAAIRVQAQIFTGRALVSTCVADPGEIRTLLPAESAPYDIFFKHGTTGWEIARKLGCEAVDITLSQINGQYILTRSKRATHIRWPRSSSRLVQTFNDRRFRR